MDAGGLRDEIVRLGPWHLMVDVTPEISTSLWRDHHAERYQDPWGEVGLADLESRFKHLITQVYPDGLGGRSFLDCACNCGGYTFWAKDLGAGRCYGFDVREHWIAQAEFLQRHRREQDVTFEVRDLYSLDPDHERPFEVTMFKGILYHLPDPVGGLRRAADLTDELIVVNTATTWDDPDGSFRLKRESSTNLMSGVYELSWLPTGPQVVEAVLRWMGFVETRMTFWVKEKENWGRMEILGSKKKGLLPPADVLRTTDPGSSNTGEFRWR